MPFKPVLQWNLKADVLKSVGHLWLTDMDLLITDILEIRVKILLYLI